MKRVRINVSLSDQLMRKLRNLAPGLKWVPQFGEPTPKRPKPEPEPVDPVSEVFDRQNVRGG